MSNDLPHIGKRVICAVASKPFESRPTKDFGHTNWFCHLRPLLLACE